MTEKDTPDSAKSSIWGGRFSSGPSQLMQDINASIDYDKRLYRQDIAGSRAHASMLAACGIISESDRTEHGAVGGTLDPLGDGVGAKHGTERTSGNQANLPSAHPSLPSPSSWARTRAISALSFSTRSSSRLISAFRASTS